MANEDAKLEVDADVPGFLKDVDRMASGMLDRFAAVGKRLTSVFTSMFGSTTPSGGNWQQTPMARTTKELAEQHKLSMELLKVERQRRDIQRAQRFEANRARYGENAELNENGELRRSPRGFRFQQTIQGLASGVNMIGAYANSGGSNAGAVQLMSGVAQMLAPTFAPLINAIGNLGIKAYEKQDLFREQALRRFQVAGKLGEDIDEGSAGGRFGGPADMTDLRKQLGFNITDFSRMFVTGARSGAFDFGDAKAGMANLMIGESALGIGSNMSSMYGAAGRSGGLGKNQDQLTGYAVGLGVAQGLSQGRMGEVFDQLATALDANADGLADVADTADRMLFVSQLGPQFKGNTTAAKAMDQSLQGLAKGGTPYTSMTMLQAGGFGQPGVSYTQAMERAQTGLGMQGGISNKDMLEANFGPYVPAYKNGSADQKSTIVYILSQLTGMPMPRVRKIMDQMASGPLGHVDPARGAAAFDLLTPHMPRYLMAPRTNAAEGEDAFRAGIKDNGPGDIVHGFSMRNERSLQNAAENYEKRKAIGQVSNRDLREAAARYGIPESFLRDWIKIESAGILGPKSDTPNPSTKTIARGFGQVLGPATGNNFAGTEAGMLNINTQEDFQRLSSDPAFSLNKTAELAGMYRFRAKKLAKDKGINTFSDSDLLHLTKLQHGGVGYADQIVSGFEKHEGHAPKSWEELYAVMSKVMTGAGRDALENANKIHVEIVDKTEGGVNVNVQTKAFKKQATKPAPGDAPALGQIVDPFE